MSSLIQVVKAVIYKPEERDRILLVRRSLDSRSFGQQYEFPGGKVEGATKIQTLEIEL